MKIFYSESSPDYQTYTFNYAIYCLKEASSELPAIYDKGFLPYTGDLTINQDLFYLARSLRVDLDRFTNSSENRRVMRKVEMLQIDCSLYEKDKLIQSDPIFENFCLDYAKNRIGDAMRKERFQYILARDTASHIFRFTQNEVVIGYVLGCLEGNFFHYWFSFFDLELMKSHSIGKWMMWKCIDWSRENQLKHVYLGTCYGEKSLYKVRDHKGLAFFDGARWNPDMNTLKSWCKSDREILTMDRFKHSPDRGHFLDDLT